MCNRSSLAIFLIVNKIGEEIFQGIGPFVENHIITKESLNHLKKKIEASKNPELIRSALAVTVAGTFIAMKLLEWGLSSSIAEYSTGSLVQLYHIGTLLILKEAVVLGAGLTAIMVYKKLSRETG